MVEITTIGISKDAKEKAREAKHERETWDEFVQRLCEEPPRIVEYVERDETEAELFEQAVQQNPGMLEDSNVSEELVRLEPTERRKIAEEVAEQLRQ